SFRLHGSAGATGIARWGGLSSLIPVDRNATCAREGFTMDMDRDISRRHMLALSAAAGGLAFEGGMSRAFAHASTRIEQLAPELDKIIATSEPIKELATGFGGPLGPAEGPLWWKEGGFLLFTDIHNSRRMKHMPGQAPTVDLEPSNRANGLTRDQQGRLL